MEKFITRKDKNITTPKSELDPWRVICGHLFELNSYYIPEIIDKTGMAVNWTLTEREDWSDKYRKAAYRPRINAAYELLSAQDRLRVAHIVACELSDRGHGDALSATLQKIGWLIEQGRLIPTRADVKELFFPKDTQHDAYLEIRRLFQNAKSSITIIDAYLDSSIFIILGTISSLSVKVRILTHKIPTDFPQEAQKFLAQHSNFTVEVRKSKQFHDRFIILDSVECWHVGCSIKDAGNRAFMLSKIDDQENRDALITQLKNSWSNAEIINV
jgi:hypothetical protein